MSLDVRLTVKEKKPVVGSGIFIRKNGSTEEITKEQWNELYPDREPVTIKKEEETNEVFTYNITHNLVKMAIAAGIYEALWKPEELGLFKALQIIPYLDQGLIELTNNPKKYKKLNPSNGWGTYEGLIKFITEYKIACSTYPDADVSVWR